MKRVKRPAKAGEFVEITKNPTDTASQGVYKKGDVIQVSKVVGNETYLKDLLMNYTKEPMFVKHSEYVVLEDYEDDGDNDFGTYSPICSTNDAKINASLPFQQIEQPDLIMVPRTEWEKLKQDVQNLCNTVFLDTFQESEVPSQSQKKIYTRKEVIEMAHFEWNKILAEEYSGDGMRYTDSRFDNWRYDPKRDTVTYFVDRIKKTVTVNVKFGENVYANATSKCMDADVFNEDIGKTIALYRAFGYELPDYFSKNIPQPERIQIGYTVELYDKDGRYIDKGRVRKIERSGDHPVPQVTIFGKNLQTRTAPESMFTIVEDFLHA